MKLNEKGKEKIKKQIIALVPMELDEALLNLNFSVDDFDELQTISPGFTFLMGKVVNALEESGKKDLANELVEILGVGHFITDSV